MKLVKNSPLSWKIEPYGKMSVPAIFYANDAILEDLDEKVFEQLSNVASLPGIVKAAYAMPDAHWGYGFPIGGVAAFDPDKGGVISAGGVGFDISCGVRTIKTGMKKEELEKDLKKIADLFYTAVPAGVGSTGDLRLNAGEMEKMLSGGARWAVERGYGTRSDLEMIEGQGCEERAQPDFVSDLAKKRQLSEMGTLGSGNHYVEFQFVSELFDSDPATNFNLEQGDVVISIHCGSRGLGHQIATEFSKRMVKAAAGFGLFLPDRELASAPIRSTLGEEYLGAMFSGMNCAMANRQILTQKIRDVFMKLYPKARMNLLYDVSHNTCKLEKHEVDGVWKELYVHRKGATRALGPQHRELPPSYAQAGQPVLIGGSMGTASYILAGTEEGEALAFSSACHGAGRTLSRNAAKKKWDGNQIIRDLSSRGIEIRSKSYRGIAEEAPEAYKDVNDVVEVTHQVGLARKVAKLKPLVCIKG